MQKRTTSGIYLIHCLSNGKKYIGSSWRMQVRFAEHLKDLSENNHDSKVLQEDWNAYGADSFTFTVLEYAGIERRQREQALMDEARAAGYELYNLRRAFNPENTTANIATAKRSQIRSWNRPKITPEEAKERQRRAVAKNLPMLHAKRRAERDMKISAALASLAERGHARPTQKLIACEAGCSVSTVQNWQKFQRRD